MMNNNVDRSHQIQWLEKKYPYLATACEAIDIEKLATFLSNPDWNGCVVQVWHPKVVQKSYGKEKRAFYPPPILNFAGNGWRTTQKKLNENLVLYRARLHAELDMNWKDGDKYRNIIKKFPDMPLRTNVDVGITPGDPLFHFNIQEKLQVKGMHISSTDRRRLFNIHYNLVECLGPSGLFPVRIIGKFETSQCRVVSKPAKKQIVRGEEHINSCLKSGMQVSLYQRSRRQAISTRYLHVTGNAFIPTVDLWTSFYIYAIDITDDDFDERIDSNEFPIQDGIIHYGDVIRLVDVKTGVSTPNLYVRKIDKDVILVREAGPGPVVKEPVAQSQKVALQFYNTERTYWGTREHDIIQHETNAIDETRHEYTDAISWSLVHCEFSEFKFFELMGPTLKPVTPIPFVESAQLHGGIESNASIEFVGSNFNPHLKVFFGLRQAEIIYLKPHSILCRVPRFQDVLQESTAEVCSRIEDGTIRVPICYVRDDGVAYLTKFEFFYNELNAGLIGSVAPTE